MLLPPHPLSFSLSPPVANPLLLLLPLLQADLDYYMFWATVYHSQLPYFKAQAKFIHDVIKIREWKVGWQTDTSIEVIRCHSGSCRVEDTLYQLAPVVVPRMPLPAQPGPADLKLRPSERSPLVSAVGTPTAFKVGRGTAHRRVCPSRKQDR